MRAAKRDRVRMSMFFVITASDERFGFLQFMGAYETIRKRVGEDVELGYSTREGLSPYVRADVESEAVRVFNGGNAKPWVYDNYLAELRTEGLIP
jgi:hypothetical protein